MQSEACQLGRAATRVVWLLDGEMVITRLYFSHLLEGLPRDVYMWSQGSKKASKGLDLELEQHLLVRSKSLAKV